jgi:hypothetical protein
MVIIHMRNVEFERGRVAVEDMATGGAERDHQDGDQASEPLRFQA